MRIVGGKWRGKKLAVPDGKDTRPTLDRVRETVFNILEHNPTCVKEDGTSPLQGTVVLDAFAGSGALGLEAMSRGAVEATLFETDRAAQAAIRQNLSDLKAGSAVKLITGSAMKPPRAAQAADVVFLDPPYGQGLVEAALTALTASGWIAPGTLVYAETDKRENLTPPERSEIVVERKIGNSMIRLVRF